jgi:hypothetical protein
MNNWTSNIYQAQMKINQVYSIVYTGLKMTTNYLSVVALLLILEDSKLHSDNWLWDKNAFFENPNTNWIILNVLETW